MLKVENQISSIERQDVLSIDDSANLNE